MLREYIQASGCLSMISFVTTIAPMIKEEIQIIQNNCFDCFDSCPIEHEVIIVGESFGVEKVCEDRNYKFGPEV